MEARSYSVSFEVPDDVVAKWQAIVDLLAQIIGIPAALVMRLVDTDIEVFVSSQSAGNPYKKGDREHFFGSGLYCETVITTKNKLLVANALSDKIWKDNPDIKLNMISYLGYPVLLPDGRPFGTLCVLDNQANSYNTAHEQVLENFRSILEGHLALLFMNKTLGDEKKLLTDYISEIKTLRGILPICSLCQKIRKEDGTWDPIEVYVRQNSEAEFSHTFCPKCAAKWRREQGLTPGS